MKNELGNNIEIITAEINSYKQVAGQAIFEIGKRLKHVKENDLVHGQWEKWCKNELNFSSRQARKYIKAYQRFNENQGFLCDLSASKILELAELPEELSLNELLNNKYSTSSDSTPKTIGEMSTKELREIKKIFKRKETADDSMIKQSSTSKTTESKFNIYGFLSEKEFEQQLITNLNAVEEGMTLLRHQVEINGGVIDILAKDKENKLCIIELKVKPDDERLVFQALYYPKVVNEIGNDSMLENGYRMITICPDYSYKIASVLKDIPHVEMMKYKLNKNNAIEIEKFAS